MPGTERSSTVRVVPRPRYSRRRLALFHWNGASLQAEEGLDDDPRALLHGQPRGIQDQVVEQRIGEILVKMLPDEATPLTVRGLHVAGRLGRIEAALPADQRDPVLV